MAWKPVKPQFAKYKSTVFTKAARVSSFIFQIGEYEALRLPSKSVPIDKIKSKETQTKIKYLKECLLKYRKLTGYGRGLAAVQVGIPERFFVIYTPKRLLTHVTHLCHFELVEKSPSPQLQEIPRFARDDSTQGELLTIINPKVTKSSSKLLRYPEMCMSANPIIAPTIRPSWIEFEYYDEQGNL